MLRAFCSSCTRLSLARITCNFVCFFYRGVFGHTLGDLPWEKCEDFSISPCAKLIGMIINFVADLLFFAILFTAMTSLRFSY